MSAALCLAGCSGALPPATNTARPGAAPRIAVMPVSNLSGASVPVSEVRRSLIRSLESRGAAVLDDPSLEQFMARHRVRYTGGIDGETGRALKEETGTDAVLFAAVEAATVHGTPRFALTARLVSAGSEPAVIWADSRALAGDDAPGLLELGLIRQPRDLREKAITQLAGSLVSALAGLPQHDRGLPSSFQPRRVYRSAALEACRAYRVAVIPLQNKTEQEHAGEIVALEFIAAMKRFPRDFEIVEPGVVRSGMLRYRLIMEQGLSLANADVLFEVLQADLILMGNVSSYEDDQGISGAPRVSFSPVLLAREGRSIAWSSNSYNQGDDTVHFFDIGRVSSAAAIARLATRATVKAMAEQKAGPRSGQGRCSEGGGAGPQLRSTVLQEGTLDEKSMRRQS